MIESMTHIALDHARYSFPRRSVGMRERLPMWRLLERSRWAVGGDGE